jgi:hypothetical protein
LFSWLGSVEATNDRGPDRHAANIFLQGPGRAPYL